MKILYNQILLISREEKYFSVFLKESLDNKILLFFVHLSFIFNQQPKKENKNYQLFFDFIFRSIERDLREIGYGDMSVNKKMKILLTKFYSILIDFKAFSELAIKKQRDILKKYFVDIKNIDEFSNYLVFFFKSGYKGIDLTSLNDNTCN